MPNAIHDGSTLALNSSNDPSIPREGLVLEAGVPTPVTANQAVYLRTLPNVTVDEDPTAPYSTFTPSASADPKE